MDQGLKGGWDNIGTGLGISDKTFRENTHAAVLGGAASIMPS